MASFHDLRVARVLQETADARSFVLQIPDALRETFRYQAGQYLTFEVALGGAALARCYSLSSSPDCDAETVVTVKRVADGRVSNWFHDELRAGDVLRVVPPGGRFVLRPASERPLALFGAGSGITPVISILKTALATTARRARLVYANRDRDSIIFREALDALAQRHRERFAILHHLDVEHGFLDREGVRRAVNGLEDAEFYLCGPAPFMEVVEATLRELGVPRERILIERFTPEEAVLADTGHEASALVIHIDGGTHAVPCAPGETVLAAVRRAGLNPPSACEDGYCGCCMAKLVRGRVEMARCNALDEDEVADGWILTCQSRPATPECEVHWDD